MVSYRTPHAIAVTEVSVPVMNVRRSTRATGLSLLKSGGIRPCSIMWYHLTHDRGEEFKLTNSRTFQMRTPVATMSILAAVQF